MNQQLALYDGLPVELKRLYDEAPIELDVEQFVRLGRALGVSKAVEHIKNAFVKVFPTWGPLEAKRRRRI